MDTAYLDLILDQLFQTCTTTTSGMCSYVSYAAFDVIHNNDDDLYL